MLAGQRRIHLSGCKSGTPDASATDLCQPKWLPMRQCAECWYCCSYFAVTSQTLVNGAISSEFCPPALPGSRYPLREQNNSEDKRNAQNQGPLATNGNDNRTDRNSRVSEQAITQMQCRRADHRTTERPQPTDNSHQQRIN